MRLEYNGGIGDARVDVLVIAISQHYRLARRLVKEACSSKAKAVSMTDEDVAAGRYLSDVILKYGGKTIGGYCRECFEKATAGLDLRSYKLKFALIRLRDSLKPIPAHRDIARRMDFLVEFAERLAGCVPDEKRRGKSSKSSKSSKNDCVTSIGPLFDSQDEREMPVLSVSIPGFDSVMPAARKDSHEAPESKKARKSSKDKSYEKLSSYILSHADKDPDCEGSEDSGESDDDVEECQEDKEEQPDHTEQREQPEQYQQEEEE